jgi:ribosomal protein L3 glutamine methyltransferase
VGDYAVSVAPSLRTVRDWLRYATTRLGQAEVYLGQGQETVWDEAAALVFGCLRLPQDRAEWILDGVLLPEEGAALEASLERRVGGTPTAYLTGLAPYCGWEFHVDERVLIPRSPLGAMLLEGLQPWLGEALPERILDMCTGSGCLGIVAAFAFPEAEVVLADIDGDALTVAERNVAKHGLEHRVRLRAGDGLAAVAGDAPFDLVLANPPYVDAASMAALPREFHAEPRHALAAGPEGLDFVEPFLAQLPTYLAATGWLVLEVGHSEAYLLERYPLVPWIFPDLPQGGAGVVLLSGADLHEAAARGALAWGDASPA